MNRFRLATALSACLLFAASGCAGRFRGDAHVDTTYDFSKVNSFVFAPERPEMAATKNGQLLEAAIRNELLSRGYREVAKSDGGVLISYQLGVYAAARLSGDSSFANQKGGITVRVMDPKTRRTVWYGWSEKTLSPEDTAEVAIPEAVSALFANRIPHAP